MPSPSPAEPDRATLAARLRAAGCVYAEDEADLLLEAAAGDRGLLESLTVRRAGGEPLEQVVGWAEFQGVRLVVAPGVFVPRARTGLVARLAGDAVRERVARRRSSGTGTGTGTGTGAPRPALVLDLCCGVGAVGAAVLRQTPRGAVDLWAADVDPVACDCARRNLPGAHVVRGDLFAALPVALRGRFDVIAANAPYVPSGAVATMPREAREHERLATLDGGPDGLDMQRRIVAEVGRWLAPGGRLVVETGRGQAAETRRIMADAGLAAHVEVDDELDATAAVGATPGP